MSWKCTECIRACTLNCIDEPTYCPIYRNREADWVWKGAVQYDIWDMSIFTYLDCPEDAVCAAINSDGTAYWTNCDRLCRFEGNWIPIEWEEDIYWKPINGKFRTENWAESLIHRSCG